MTYVTVSVPITTVMHEEIEARVKAGDFANRAEYIRKALELMRREQLLSEIRAAEQDIAQGRTVPFPKTKKTFIKLVEKYA